MLRSWRLSFAAGLLWGLLPVLLGRHWLGLDLLRMDLGGMCEWKNLLFSGQPLWVAPHLGLGAPFAFDPLQGVFYPPKWLYFWLPGYLATDLHVAFHFAVAASGMTALGRSFGLGRASAGWLGLCYLFSGTLIDLARHSPYLIGGAWLPWVWASARFVARGRGSLRRRSSIGLVSSLALMLLGGDAFTFVWGFAITGFEGLARRTASSLTRLMVLASFAGAIGLVVWAPAMLELSSSGRHGGVGITSALRWSWSPLDFPGVLLAGLFQRGSLLGGSFWSLLHEFGGSFPWNESPFLGLVALVALGFLPTRARRWRTDQVLVPAVLGLALLLALGSHTPLVEPIYRAFPFLTNLRYPAKHWVMVNLAALLLAGLSLSRLEHAAGGRARLFRGLVLGLWCAMALALAFTREHWVELSRSLALRQGWEWSPEAPTAVGVLLRALVPGALAALLLLTLHRKLGGRVWILALLVELMAGATLSVEWMPRQQADLNAFTPLALLEQGTVTCLSNPVERYGLTQQSLERAEDLASRMLYQRLAGLPQLNACDSVVMAHGYSIMAHEIQRQLQIGFEQFPSAARALGCTHLVSLESGAQGGGGIDLGVAGLRAHPVADPIPEFFAIDRVHPILPGRGERDYVGLTGIDMKSRDLLSHVAHLGPEARRLFERPSSSHETGRSEIRVQGRRISASRYQLALVPPILRGPIVVGVRTSHARGWRAWQSGKRLPVVAAGGIFLAAVVANPEAGAVEFRYGW